VQLFGTNWQLLERILPGRPRRALRNKFRAEQRREPVCRAKWRDRWAWCWRFKKKYVRNICRRPDI